MEGLGGRDPQIFGWGLGVPGWSLEVRERVSKTL